MSERSISVRLRAHVADFKREIGSASDSLGDLAKRAGGTEKVAQTSLGRVAQSARLQREAWTTAGAGLAAFGAAVTGIGIAALNTGIQYNTLQQTSRAALKTLTGSAEAANAQMDKLDEFARTSPFAKDVFIKAQQQMLGFGIEAGKVIPYLSAINDAVAATGGSNQDIAELTRIFSQVQAASKITAVDLMQFGQRGVNAAELIGSQMGKTGAQIREDITNGSLDAGTALDALAAGMSERFEGASANVKNTFAGAFDRVKAAWRDLSSDIAEPLVGAEGGGLGVDALNRLADALRAFQGLSDPLKDTVVGLGGIAGAGALAAGTFLLLFPRIMDTATQLRNLNKTFPGASKGLRGLATAAGLVTFAAIITELEQLRARAGVAQVDVDNLAEALERMADGATDLPVLGDIFESGNALPMFRREITTTEDALAEFADQAQQALGSGWADQLERFLGDGGVTRFGEQVSQIDAALVGLVNSGSAEAAAATLEMFLASVDPDKVDVEELREQFTGYASAMEQVESATEGATAATEAAQEPQKSLASIYAETKDEIMGQSASLRELMDLELERSNIIRNSLETESAFQAALDGASAAIEENGKTLDLNTEAGRDNQAALLKIRDAALDNSKALLEVDGSSSKARAAMQRGRDEFVKAAEAAGMGADEANRLADELGLLPETVTVTVRAHTRDAIAAAEEAVRRIRDTPAYMRIYGIYQKTIGAPGNLGMLAKADGGPIYGPGTSTSDSIPAWLSNGEFVVNAASTSKYRQILDLINAGRYAGGGQVRPQSYMSTSTAAAPMSLDGLAISGRLEMDTSGFVRLVDGRIQQSKRAGELAGRPA